MRLLVFWGSKGEADFQTPKEVKWEDGSPATLEDYYTNQLATQSVHPTEKVSLPFSVRMSWQSPDSMSPRAIGFSTRIAAAWTWTRRTPTHRMPISMRNSRPTPSSTSPHLTAHTSVPWLPAANRAR